MVIYYKAAGGNKVTLLQLFIYCTVMLQSALTVSCVKGHLAKKQQQTRSQVKVSSLLAMPLVDLVNVAEHDLLGAFETVGFGDVTVVDQLHVALSVCTCTTL